MSLVARWPLNGHARDIVGGLDATRVSGSGLTWNTSPIGLGAQFNANDDRIIIPHDDYINNRCFGKSKEFSVSFFYYPISYSDYGCVIQKARAGSWSNSTMGVWIYSGGIRFIMGSDVSGNPSASYTAITKKPPVNQWVHVTCIADSKEMGMYLNGELVGRVDISTISHPRTSNDAPITIGPRYDNDGTYSSLRGVIADIKLYDHVLSKQEIMENGLGLMSHWPLTNPPINGEISGDCINSSNATLLPDYLYKGGIPGEITSYIEFTGTLNGGVSLPKDDFSQNSKWGSVSFWFKIDQLTNYKQWLWHTYVNRDRGTYISETGEIVGLVIRGGTDPSAGEFATGKTINVGEWHHLTMSWNISTGAIHLHLDGVLIHTENTGSWTDVENGDETTIGTSTVGGRTILGKVAHFKTFASPLSSHQVKLLYKKRTSMSMEGALNIENLNEGYDRIAAKGEFLVVDSGFYGDIPIYAYEDNTDLYIGGYKVATLSRGESYTLPTSMQSVGLSISAFGKPISIGGTRNCISTRWAGKAFGVWVDRDPGEIVIFAPFSDATVEVVSTPFADATETISTITIPAGESHAVPNEIQYLYFIRSNVDICVYAMGVNYDNRPVYPASKELYGIASGHADLVSLTDGDVEVFGSDGSYVDYGFKRKNSGTGNVAATGGLYTGASSLIKATGLVCVHAQADSDGGEITPFITKDAMSTHFLLPSDCDFVAFVGLEDNVAVKHLDTNMIEQQSTTAISNGEGFPSKARLEGGLLAGHWIICDRPVYAIMQPTATDDETVLYGYNPDVDNVYREHIDKFSENGLFPQEYIAYLPLHSDVVDHGVNGLYHDSISKPVKSDRGFTFDGIDNYLMVLSNQEAADFIGQPETQSITIAMSFKSLGSLATSSASARLITRDASDYWAVGIDQTSGFPQRLRWWDASSAYSEVGAITDGWHRLVMIRDLNTNVGKMYLDGNLLGEFVASSGPGSSRPILIGANTEQQINNTGDAFYGDIEDVHVVAGVVSEQHVKSDYQRFVKRNRSLSFDRSSKNVYQLIER